MTIHTSECNEYNQAAVQILRVLSSMHLSSKRPKVGRQLGPKFSQVLKILTSYCLAIHRVVSSKWQRRKWYKAYHHTDGLSTDHYTILLLAQVEFNLPDLTLLHHIVSQPESYFRALETVAVNCIIQYALLLWIHAKLYNHTPQKPF